MHHALNARVPPARDCAFLKTRTELRGTYVEPFRFVARQPLAHRLAHSAFQSGAGRNPATADFDKRVTDLERRMKK
jgi:hypothetical protein